MNANTTYKKILELKAEEVNFGKFANDLRKSTESNPIRIAWTTLEGRERYYFCWWNAGAYNPSNPATITREDEDMVALQVLGLEGDWRTIRYDTVTKYRFENKLYKII